MKYYIIRIRRTGKDHSITSVAKVRDCKQAYDKADKYAANIWTEYSIQIKEWK